VGTRVIRNDMWLCPVSSSPSPIHSDASFYPPRRGEDVGVCPISHGVLKSTPHNR
jgi:hypothetical protein